MLIVSFVLVLFGNHSVIAEGEEDQTIFDKKNDFTKLNLVELTLDKKNKDTDLPKYTGSYVSMGSNDGILMTKDKGYSVTYPMKYLNGTDLIVEVTATLTDATNDTASGTKYSRVYTNSDDLLSVGWLNAKNCRVQWDVSVYDPADNNKSYLKYLFFGFKDPDESDYIFDTTNRTVYYDPDKCEAAKYYYYKDNGLYLSGPVTDFDQEMLYVQMVDENTFTFETETKSDGAIAIPYFYAKQYKIIYKMNDDDSEVKATPDPTNPNGYAQSPKAVGNFKEPTRPGYKFTGWTEELSNGDIVDNDVIAAESTGDKTFVANWVKVEYKLAYDKNHDNAQGTMEKDPAVLGMNDTTPNQFTNRGYDFKGWSLEPGVKTPVYKDDDDVPVTKDDITYTENGEEKVKNEGEVVKTLYAQWDPKKYQILYNPNAKDATGEMPTQTFDVVTNPETWDSTKDWQYKREGYDFVGYKVENTGETFKDPNDFKEYLLDEEDQEVELFAQWKPWEYYIKYDGNGADNKDAMPTQTFDYFAGSMKSKENAFKRDGYKFTGFAVTINGNVRIITTPEEFRDVLKAMGPYSTVLLVAQWERVPEKVVAIPVTGVE